VCASPHFHPREEAPIHPDTLLPLLRAVFNQAPRAAFDLPFVILCANLISCLPKRFLTKKKKRKKREKGERERAKREIDV
jgi:hypothetical protein